MTAHRVLLLRHGQTAYNAEDRFQGQSDIPLDDVGVDQAKRAADQLGTLLDGLSVRIVSSDLQRARATAEPLAERLGAGVETDPRLREVFAGEWEGLRQDEIIARWPDDFAAWRRGDGDVRLGGGESRREAAARAAAAIEDAQAGTPAGGTLVCVGHGGTLRGAILQLIGMSGWPWHALEGLRSAHWAELHRGERGWRLGSYNVG